jgi:hypothetical protein
MGVTVQATLSAWRHQREFLATPAAQEYDRRMKRLEEAMGR